MERLKMQTSNIADDNFQKLAALFPNAVTEIKNENGEIIRAIDADILRREISAPVVEGSKERYQFTWPDKNLIIHQTSQEVKKTLRLVREKSVGKDGTPDSIDTENIYIEGDNLDVLKILRTTYRGKVKMIYIDPPYNTGHDFVYDDDFSQTQDEYYKNSGQFNFDSPDEKGGRLVQNLESNGRFHTDWLNMIYPRLKIARDFLSDDGVIFISIGINEQHNLRKVCDEIFYGSNMIMDIIWNSRKSVSNDAVVSLNHNYTLVYAKNMNVFYKNRISFKFPDTGEGFDNPDNDPRGLWKADPFDSPGIRPNLTYAIINPNTGTEYWPPEGRCWRTGEKEYKEFLRDGRIIFGKSGSSKPQLKRFLSEAQLKGITPKSLWDDCGTATEATKEIQDIFGSKVFDTPKPILLITRMLQLATNSDSIVMDFFSGSATTAHAVMKLNAEDGGKRKFILVQIPEETPENSEARKAGYKTICEIGEERIRRAGKKIREDDEKWNGVPLGRLDGSKVGEYTPSKVIDIIFPEDGSQPIELVDERKFPDVGFRVFKVDSSNMKDVFYSPDEFQQDQLEFLASNIKEDRTPEDLLFQVMPEFNIPLSAEIEEEIINDKKVFTVEEGFLIACFDSEIDEETVKAIALRKPYYAVFRDSGMSRDSVITNFEQIFETYSPETTRKIL